MTEDLQAQAPFSFDCHRCGNCCRVGHGQVWVTEMDVQKMASRLQMPVEGFVTRIVRSVGGRLSLREEGDGSCSLLQGSNACTVYEERPAQCRSFPFWPQLMEEGRALELAAGYCQGIQRYPDPGLVQKILPEVLELLLAAGATESNEPSDGSETHWSSSLEVDLFLASGRRFTLGPKVDGEELRRQLQDLATRSGYPWAYAPWARLLTDRRGGWSTRGNLPSLPSA